MSPVAEAYLYVTAAFRTCDPLRCITAYSTLLVDSWRTWALIGQSLPIRRDLVMAPVGNKVAPAQAAKIEGGRSPSRISAINRSERTFHQHPREALATSFSFNGMEYLYKSWFNRSCARFLLQIKRLQP
jgi:hypothetical protein